MVAVEPTFEPEVYPRADGLRVELEHRVPDAAAMETCLHTLGQSAKDLSGPELTVALNAFVRSVDFGVLYVVRWIEISSQDAVRILGDNLHRDQMRDEERVPLRDADRLAREFLALFQSGWCRLFTNAEFETIPRTSLRRAVSWTGSVTGATMEAGVVALNQTRIGLLFLSDDDPEE